MLRRSRSDSSRGTNKGLLTSHSVERPPLPPKSSASNYISSSRSFRRMNYGNAPVMVRSQSGEAREFNTSSPQDKTDQNSSQTDNVNEPVRRPSIADLQKSIWFEKNDSTSMDMKAAVTSVPLRFPSDPSRNTVTSSMASSVSSLISSVSSRTMTNSLSVSQFSTLFKSDTLSNKEGSFDSVIVKLKETAVPLPPAQLVSMPPTPPPKPKMALTPNRSSSCPNKEPEAKRASRETEKASSNSSSG